MFARDSSILHVSRSQEAAVPGALGHIFVYVWLFTITDAWITSFLFSTLGKQGLLLITAKIRVFLVSSNCPYLSRLRDLISTCKESTETSQHRAQH